MKLRKSNLLLLLFIWTGFMVSCSTVQDIRKTQGKVITKKPVPKPQPPSEPKKPVEPGKTDTPKAPKKEEPIKFITPVTVALPEIKREFRAAWIASVANINWPSRKDLTVSQQKAEAIEILNTLEENNFNAVILQVRPSADALYESPYEPWSYFLTGLTGRPPSPYYNPLEFWIEEAHSRGMELHAWINPYRAHHTNGGKVTPGALLHKMPNEIVKLQNGMYWFDPGKKRTQDHISKVILDLVKRYDIDGIHLDDYFYPYKSYNKGRDFPDNDSWNAYKRSGGKLSRDDWRRENVNTIVERIYREIKTQKDWVKFGISPFGIWKPGYPSDVQGMSQYDELYADAKLWLNEGWIDYYSPQLYWADSAPKQSFTSLLNWWKAENYKNRHLWPGLNTVEVRVPDRTAEILKQIQITRNILPKDEGEIHWSYAGLTEQMKSSLRNGPYREKALSPEYPWLKSLIQGTPDLIITRNKGEISASWSLPKPEEAAHWILYYKYGETWNSEIRPAREMIINLPEYNKKGEPLNIIAVRGADRLGNLSEYKALKINLAAIASKN